MRYVVLGTVVIGLTVATLSVLAILNRTATYTDTALRDAVYHETVSLDQRLRTGCRLSRGIQRHNLQDRLEDAKIVAKSSSSREIREHYLKRVVQLQTTIPTVNPRDCTIAFPLPPKP